MFSVFFLSIVSFVASGIQNEKRT